jgi:hypothetical protein
MEPDVGIKSLLRSSLKTPPYGRGSLLMTPSKNLFSGEIFFFKFHLQDFEKGVWVIGGLYANKEAFSCYI